MDQHYDLRLLELELKDLPLLGPADDPDLHEVLVADERDFLLVLLDQCIDLYSIALIEFRW